MTPRFKFPRLVAFSVSAIILFAAVSAQAAAKKPAKTTKKPAAKAAAAKTTAKGKRETAASRKDSRSSKRERAADARRGKNDRSAKTNARSSKAERRSRNDRASAKQSRKDPRKMSRRERMVAARIEAERRRREAAERARRIAIALARQRAYDQSLKDETAANIARDETTGEDLEVRRAAVEALGDKAGTVVVMNPKTGQVYTVVNQDWGLRRGLQALLDDQARHRSRRTQRACHRPRPDGQHRHQQLQPRPDRLARLLEQRLLPEGRRAGRLPQDDGVRTQARPRRADRHQPPVRVAGQAPRLQGGLRRQPHVFARRRHRGHRHPARTHGLGHRQRRQAPHPAPAAHAAGERQLQARGQARHRHPRG